MLQEAGHEILDDGKSKSAMAAEQADLIYLPDDCAGIRRRRMGRRFGYFDAKGAMIRDERVLQRIRALAIPPAWTDVWISPRARGHIQATGRDQRGRKQYRYHADWSACRDEVKFSQLADFAETLPKLRARIEADLRRRGLPFERVVASVVWLLDNTMIRVGNAAYARDNKSFGLTTLRDRHVKIEGAKLRFAFKGKSGKEWRLQLVDRRMARLIRSVQELPGQQLFQYIDEDGTRRAIASQDVNEYIRQGCGAAFSSKYFRTWGGTIAAAARLCSTEVPQTKSGRAKVMNAVIDEVAAHLGNTRSVCRKCYIHPKVLLDWSEGLLAGDMKAARRSLRGPKPGLDAEETLVWRWLRRG